MSSKNVIAIKKAWLVHLVNVFIIILGLLANLFGMTFIANNLLVIGFFAISGSITNHLAIFILFEPVPFLYGSGIISKKFDVFQTRIKDIFFQDFWSKEEITSLVKKEITQIKSYFIKNLDAEDLSASLCKKFSSSPFFEMMGGDSIIEQIKEPLMVKLEEAISSSLNEGELVEKLSIQIEMMVKEVVQNQIDNLTPEQVKNIIWEITNKYLNNLVIWGSFWGGSIGVLFNIFQAMIL